MKDFVIISYYTVGTGYEQEIQNLIESLNKFDLPHDIEGIENLGDWNKNTRYKAQFIKKKLREYNTVVFVDADAIIRQYPVLFEELDCDIAVHYRNNRELLSGTIYVQDTENTRQLVNHWIQANATSNLAVIEQRNLMQLLQQKIVPGIREVRLPASYCQIFDLMKDLGEPVIEHMQASRRLRREVIAK